ncbi:coiled-coil domain-containing protein 178-like [Haliotis rufescens]|uniref:coiled-coil domain-containing protein 178-like n=1 Tax=Haliotis rufescens TaxID=6454 RepID=UPI00201EF230|nr:coiled-coil domain-containing protein 178-like [Haliotis rufescens]
MMSTTKVVRLEEVSYAEGSFSSPSKAGILKNEESPSDGLLDKDVDGSQEKEETEEAKDKVYPLPSNWPKIPQLARRRSCELTRSTEPCVKKAVSHLELVQNIIDEWFKKAEEDVKSRTSSRRESIVSLPETRKQLRFVDDQAATASSSGHRSRTVSEASQASSQLSVPENLSVKGVGAKAEQEACEVENQGLDIPYLGAEDVIDEVITLLARLENDRHETEGKLGQERGKVSKLTTKIDDLCLRRLRDLPVLVQREHEACILDLNELQWHVAYRGRNEARIQNRREIADVLNNRLKEDIAFVERHIPLVQEKLLLEMEAMDKIKKAQAETDQELEMTKQRQAKTEQKSEEAVNKAENERGHIKRELDTVRDNLSQISEDLSEAKMTYNAYVHQLNDIRQQLKDNDQEMKILEVKNENAKVAEEMQATKVRDFQTRIAETEFEHRKLKADNQQLEQKLRTMKAQNTHKRDELKHKLKQLEGKLRTLLRDTKEAKMDKEDCEDKLVKCDNKKVYDEKNMVRINKEMRRTDTLFNTTMEEYSKVGAMNQHIREQLRTEEDKAFKTEEMIKNQCETLKKQVKDEVHSRTVLQARINSDSSEIDRTRQDSAKKQNKAQKVADEVGSAVNNVLEKVQKLRNTKDEKVKLKSDLDTKIGSIQKQHRESQTTFLERIGHLEPRHKLLKDEVLKLDKHLDHIQWKSDMMNKKIEDMDASEIMMKKIINKTEKIIDKLTDELDELQIQLAAAKKIEDDLRKAYNEVLERIRENKSKHEHLLENRQVVHKQHESEKRRCLYRNKDFASQYRQLQNDFIIMKEKLLRGYEDRVKLESAITDTKQLQSLQKKLHGALTEYFKLSGLYNESELCKLERESSQNGVRVSQLQDKMDEALVSITHFLQTQMDGQTARKMAWNTVRMQDEARAQGLKTPLPDYASRQSTVVSA